MQRSRLRQWTPAHPATTLSLATLFLATLFLLSLSARGEECPAPAGTEARLPAQEPSSPGFKAAIDPATGQLTVPPLPARGAAPATPAAAGASPASTSAAATSHVGLVAVPGTTRAGGKMVDLKGRFRSSVVATVGPDGKTTARCVETAVPAAAGTPDAR